MKRYFIEDAKCGITRGGMACGPVPGHVVASVRYNDGTESNWLTFVEVDSILNTFLTEEDIYDMVIEENFGDDEYDFFETHDIGEFNDIELGGDYSDVFDSISEDPDNPAVPLIKYLIALVRCEMEDIDHIINLGKGHFADEIDIPVSDVEEDYLEEYAEDDADLELPDDLDKEMLYRMRLSLETDIETESVYHDMDGAAFENEKLQLEAIINRCEDEDEYQSWKQTYIDAEYAKMKDKGFLVCKYIFAGIGQYESVIPKEAKESFICWINGNGSAFFGGEREATENDIRRFIALQAASYQE